MAPPSKKSTKSTDSYKVPSINFDDFSISLPDLQVPLARTALFGDFSISPPALPTEAEKAAYFESPKSSLDVNRGENGRGEDGEDGKHEEDDESEEDEEPTERDIEGDEIKLDTSIVQNGDTKPPDTEQSNTLPKEEKRSSVGKEPNVTAEEVLQPSRNSSIRDTREPVVETFAGNSTPPVNDTDDAVDSPLAATPPEYYRSSSEVERPRGHGALDVDDEENEQLVHALELSRQTAAKEQKVRLLYEQQRHQARLSRADMSSPTSMPPQQPQPQPSISHSNIGGQSTFVPTQPQMVLPQRSGLPQFEIQSPRQDFFTPPDPSQYESFATQGNSSRREDPPSPYVSPPTSYVAWNPNMNYREHGGQATVQSAPSVHRTPSNSYRPERTPLSGHVPPAERPRRPVIAIPEQPRGREPGDSSKRLQIRENSRSHSERSFQSSGQQCEECEEVGPGRSYCNVCKHVFCDPCWARQLVHRRPTGSLPHEKTDFHRAKTIQNALAPAWTEAEREKLHQADIDTTWFGVARENEELPLFRDYGRYAALIKETKDIRIDSLATLSASSDQSETIYPSLVSFVGETGAGKSTLIKLLIDLKSAEGERFIFPTPVVGAAGRDIATSEDVHLYLDPSSSESQAPLLFADCEGLDGGERDPMGARLKRKIEKEAKQAASTGSRRRHRLKHTSERELVWADTPRKRSREFAVAQLYPRLLYTFSDAIVFVLKNARVVEKVLERLVEWASAALEKSSNQPVLPHAIIALNASENSIDDELWDVDKATEALMESLARSVYQNPTFKKYAQFWRERDRQIESVQELLLSYYSSLRVVRIPADGRPNLIGNQMEKLLGMIQWASKNARHRKADLRMLLDADDFQPYLQTAFDHFALDLNIPFDFVQASFANSPIPNDFGGNILKLAIQVMECWKDRAKGPVIFEELSYLVASCIMLNAARAKVRGTDADIFPKYLDHLDNALENFCDRHWPCEFIDPRGGRCVNVRSGHGAKGHQSKSGKLLATGEYCSGFTFDGYKNRFWDNTFEKLTALRRLSRAREGEQEISEEQAAAEIHRDFVLPYFFQHASGESSELFVSHTVCFCCLYEAAEHALPCGHIICTSCLKAYGKYQLRTYVEISECPLESREQRWRKVWQVYLKPASCGIRVLTLDGGGVRGIVILEILQQIERELGGGLHIQSFFDLIVGTSTGGIIALGLTARNWTLNECISHFEELCAKAFTPRKGINVPGVGWFVSNYNHSTYETQPLQEALISSFTEDQYLFGGSRRDQGTMDVKVAVTATSTAGTGVVFGNYNRLCHEKLNYHFQRPEKLHGELKTWEAARATSAAPTYFKPFCHESSKQVYSDGGVYNNNPVFVADRERKLIWPAHEDEEPDIILSIGTMWCKKSKSKPSTKYTGRGIINYGRHLSKLAQDHVHSDLDSEATWQKYISARAPSRANRPRYVRINPEAAESVPKLDDKAQLRSLKQTTKEFAGSSTQIKQLVCRLVATCFFLDVLGEVQEDVEKELFIVQGYFRCRFLAGPEVAELGKFIRQHATAGHDAHFLIEEEDNDELIPHEVLIGPRVLNRMIEQRVFRIEQTVSIRRSSQSSKTSISLCLRRDAKYPISGSPRKLHAAKATPAHTGQRHGISSTNSVRWAGRTKSQQQRVEWRPPNIPAPAEKEDIITRYSDATHLLGNATQMDLMMPSSLQYVDDEALRYGPRSAVDDPSDFVFELDNNEVPRPRGPLSELDATGGMRRSLG